MPRKFRGTRDRALPLVWAIYIWYNDLGCIWDAVFSREYKHGRGGHHAGHLHLDLRHAETHCLLAGARRPAAAKFAPQPTQDDGQSQALKNAIAHCLAEDPVGHCPQFAELDIVAGGSITDATGATRTVGGVTGHGSGAYGLIGTWNVSGVTNMNSLFIVRSQFNQDLSLWDVSNVVNMWGMFFRCYAFNGDISPWVVSKVQTMERMFQDSRAFNGDISLWDVSSVETMKLMFASAEAFNRDISSWDVSSVKDMYYMFDHAKAFNQGISSWDVSNVETMQAMFYEASAFNQDISPWNVLNVLNMKKMFYEAAAFNQDLSSWDVSNVLDFEYMFTGSAFNHDLSSWTLNADAQKVTSMFPSGYSHILCGFSWVERVLDFCDDSSGCEPTRSYPGVAGTVCPNLCPPGQYAEAGFNEITGDLKRGDECTLCPAGKYVTTKGNLPEDCVACPVGTFSSPGLSTCVTCAAGEYADDTGAETCDQCPGGYWTTASDHTECAEFDDVMTQAGFESVENAMAAAASYIEGREAMKDAYSSHCPSA